MDASNVWVVSVNAKSPTFHRAGKFGGIKFLTEGYIDLQHPDLMSIIQRRIERNMSANDYLLLSGNKLMNALALHYAIEKFGTVNVLYYDGAVDEYKLKVVSNKIPS